MNAPAPTLPEVVDALRTTSRADIPALVEGWLDTLDAEGRWAMLKLITGELRVGLSARLAKTAAASLAADYGHEVSASEVEEVWHGLEPPYVELFAWLEGRGDRPSAEAPGRFRPMMLSQPIDEAVDFGRLDATAYAAEWKWDGIRVQAIREGGEARLYSRTGDEISGAFPDLMAGAGLRGRAGRRAAGAARPPRGALRRPAAAAEPQGGGPKVMQAYPVAIRAYDILSDAGEDVRGLAWAERRGRLEALVGAHGGQRLDLSPLVPFDSWDALAARSAPTRRRATPRRPRA